MTTTDKPQGGVRLDMAFGERRDARPAALASTLTFKLVVVGDFGGNGDGRVRDISGEDIASLLSSFDAAVVMQVPNHFGSPAPALAVRLPIAAISDLDPRTIASRVPEIAQAEQAVPAPIIAAPHEESREDESATPSREDQSLDRLLGMVDVAAPKPEPDAAKAAVAAFLSSMAKPRPASTAPKPGVNPLVRQQVGEIIAHPSWLAVEAAWRSLRLIFAARGRRNATRLALCDVKREATAETLQSEAFAAAATDEADTSAVLVLGAFGRSTSEFDRLDQIAIAADQLNIPVIVSLAPDFLGAPPEQVAGMDNPAALLEAPPYAAWRGLRSRDESRSVIAAWNDFVLRPAMGDAPVLWGEPGVLLAAQILRSLARLEWPTEIVGAETALAGLDVAETETRGGRQAAIPLRTAIDPGVARDLGNEGIACLVCRPDRDQAWFTRAPALYGLGAMAEDDRKVMTNFNSLPFRLIAGYFESLLRAHQHRFKGNGSAEDDAASIMRLLEAVLPATGQGAAARVVPTRDEDGRPQFEVTIRLGKSIMDGFTFSFEFAP